MNPEEFTHEDRRKCEIQLHKLLAWVGVQYPENLDMPCGKVCLRKVIFNLLTKSRLSGKDLKNIDMLRHCLIETRRKKEEQLETLEMTVPEGRKLCREIAAIIRAIDTLRDIAGLRKKKWDFHYEVNENRIKSEKRWIKYLEEIRKVV